MTTIDPPLSAALSTDCFFLREQLTEEQLGVLRTTRAFVDVAVDQHLLGAPRAAVAADPPDGREAVRQAARELPADPGASPTRSRASRSSTTRARRAR
jgi:hypothetical protein